MSSDNIKAFLTLVRSGIGHQEKISLPEQIDWQVIETLANEQGLSAILVDGVEKLHDDNRPPKLMLLQWIGETLQGYEYRYEQYCKAIAELAGYYNHHGFKMMVLKGYACALDWPKPKHRPCGDIDIWLFGQQKEVDKVLSKEKGIEIDQNHHHHTVFNWGDFMVENHYDFVNVYAHKSSRELEMVFKELGQDDSLSVEVCGEKIYLPTPNLHALFLIRHLVLHFTAANITMRQVLDWGFFVEKHTKGIDWKWLVVLLEKYHMKDFYNCLNAICVENLGFGVNIFPQVQFEPNLKERVLNDILDPAFTAEEPRGLLKRLVYKYRRWQGNAWKQEMCYGESRTSAFWHGVWMHLMKPKSI